VPDPACPRCGVPLHDQPDYCWSCGYDVSDRWRTNQLGEGEHPEPRIVEPADAPIDPRRVGVSGGDDIATTARAGRTLRLLLVVALVVIAVLAVLAVAGGHAATGASTPGPTIAGTRPGGASALAPGAASARAFAPTGPTTEATITRVVDGDTVIADIGGQSFRVRYIGMDTPESVKPNTPVEPMAKEAAAANERLVDGQRVILERDVSETDRYDRLLRDVWVERDGVLVLVGLELVRAGFAQVTTFPPDVKYVDELLAAQAQARDAGLGLWAGS
jgi:micrococcal nuclease